MGKGGDELARARIPELSGFVLACREDPSAVRTKRRVVDRILMNKGGYVFARSRIPEIGAVIFRACRQHSCTVRAKRRVKDARPRCSKEAMSLPEAASQSLTLGP